MQNSPTGTNIHTQTSFGPRTELQLQNETRPTNGWENIFTGEWKFGNKRHNSCVARSNAKRFKWTFLFSSTIPSWLRRVASICFICFGKGDAVAPNAINLYHLIRFFSFPGVRKVVHVEGIHASDEDRLRYEFCVFWPRWRRYICIFFVDLYFVCDAKSMCRATDKKWNSRHVRCDTIRDFQQLVRHRRRR